MPLLDDPSDDLLGSVEPGEWTEEMEAEAEMLEPPVSFWDEVDCWKDFSRDET